MEDNNNNTPIEDQPSDNNEVSKSLSQLREHYEARIAGMQRQIDDANATIKDYADTMAAMLDGVNQETPKPDKEAFIKSLNLFK